MLAVIGGEEESRSLKPVSWEEVGAQVYVPQWAGLVREHFRALAGGNAALIPEKLGDLKKAAKQGRERKGEAPSAEEVNRLAAAVMGAALAIALLDKGWKLHLSPGAAVCLERDEETVEPFAMAARLVSGELGADAWREKCDALGTSEISLVQALPGTEKLLV